MDMPFENMRLCEFMITLYCALDNILLQNKLSNNNAAYYDPGFYNLIKSFLQFLQLYINGML